MEAQMTLPTAATAEVEAQYATEMRERAEARLANINRRDAVRLEADKAGRIAASEARRIVYLENGYKECTQEGCSTLASPTFDRCIPHSQADNA
jgi:hypothetical protein